MRCEIVDISSLSAWHEDKERLIGLKGAFATISNSNHDGFYNGVMYLDDRLSGILGLVNFHGVKTKPIFDA